MNSYLLSISLNRVFTDGDVGYVPDFVLEDFKRTNLVYEVEEVPGRGSSYRQDYNVDPPSLKFGGFYFEAVKKHNQRNRVKFRKLESLPQRVIDFLISEAMEHNEISWYSIVDSHRKTKE